MNKNMEEAFRLYRPPAMPFYGSDWLSSLKIAGLSLEQEAVYFRLLMLQWGDDECGIPCTEQIAGLHKMGNSQDISKLLATFFKPHPFNENKLANEKLFNIKMDMFERHLKQSQGGKLGMSSRWNKKHHDNILITKGGGLSTPSSSSSSSSSSKSTPLADRRKSAAPPVKVETEWPEDDKWLLRILESMNGNFPISIEPLKDHAWWDSVAKVMNGLDHGHVRLEFDRMSAWLREHPSRQPTMRGTKTFVRRWLERSLERRSYGPR